MQFQKWMISNAFNCRPLFTNNCLFPVSALGWSALFNLSVFIPKEGAQYPPSPLSNILILSTSEIQSHIFKFFIIFDK